MPKSPLAQRNTTRGSPEDTPVIAEMLSEKLHAAVGTNRIYNSKKSPKCIREVYDVTGWANPNFRRRSACSFSGAGPHQRAQLGVGVDIGQRAGFGDDDPLRIRNVGQGAHLPLAG